MAEHPNVKLVREGYAAFSTGDMDTLTRLFDENIVWHEGGRGPLAGDYKGRDQVFGMFGKLMELTGGTVKVEVHDVLANDEHAAALVNLSVTRNGKSWSGTSVDIMHIENGTVTEFWDNLTDRYSYDEVMNS